MVVSRDLLLVLLVLAVTLAQELGFLVAVVVLQGESLARRELVEGVVPVEEVFAVEVAVAVEELAAVVVPAAVEEAVVAEELAVVEEAVALVGLGAWGVLQSH